MLRYTFTNIKLFRLTCEHNIFIAGAVTGLAELAQREKILEEFSWYVVYTRTNAEKKFAQRASDCGLRSFLPIHRVARVWSDRKKIIEAPLFKSYVFIYVDKNGLHLAKTILGFSHFIRFGAYPVVIPDEQIKQIEKIVGSGHCAEILSSPLSKDDKVRIIDGPLKNMEGILMESEGRKKLAVEFSQLGQSILVAVDSERLIKIVA